MLSRYQGDKRISSMSYVLGVMASGWGTGLEDNPAHGRRSAGDADRLLVPATANRGRFSSYTYRGRRHQHRLRCDVRRIQAGPLPARADGVRFLARPRHRKARGGAVAAERAVVPEFPTPPSPRSLRDGQTMQYVGDRILYRGRL